MSGFALHDEFRMSCSFLGSHSGGPSPFLQGCETAPFFISPSWRPLFSFLRGTVLLFFLQLRQAPPTLEVCVTFPNSGVQCFFLGESPVLRSVRLARMHPGFLSRRKDKSLFSRQGPRSISVLRTLLFGFPSLPARELKNEFPVLLSQEDGETCDTPPP